MFNVATRTTTWAEYWDSDCRDRLQHICNHVLSESGQDDHETLWWGSSAMWSLFYILFKSQLLLRMVLFYFQKLILNVIMFVSVFCIQAGLLTICQSQCWPSLSSLLRNRILDWHSSSLSQHTVCQHQLGKHNQIKMTIVFNAIWQSHKPHYHLITYYNVYSYS